jgi:hypothetical protein
LHPPRASPRRIDSERWQGQFQGQSREHSRGCKSRSRLYLLHKYASGRLKRGVRGERRLSTRLKMLRGG